MNVAYADLHMHTTCSDGQLAPAELVRLAGERGIAVLAVTDHDTVAGLQEAQEEGRRCGVEVVPGVELSVEAGGSEIHLLGYFFDPQHAELQAYQARAVEARRERARHMVEALRALGLPISFEAVRRQAAGGVVLGRPHIAAALVEAGHVATQQEAFDRYLKNDGPAYVKRTVATAPQALALLHAAGGIGVLAHPGHWTKPAVLKGLVASGLDGIEVFHPSHDANLTAYYRRKARYYELLQTGGSDFHGGRADADALGAYGLSEAQYAHLRS